MYTLITYVSIHHQNTKKVAEVIAKILKADLVDLKKEKPPSFKNYGLIGFGSGIYLGKHHQLILDFVDQLPKMKKKAFIFSTSGAPPFFSFVQHKALQTKLIRKGFKIQGELCLPGWDTYGIFKLFGGFNPKRPNEEDLQKARNFAIKLKKIN
ncbi:MAG: flavodoxin family protein [Microgenomates group bacterium]|jgi:flavodoxin|nr:flavodoxin family protein [Microgenomates group bacterium]